jgi:hypothetical protein
VWLDKLLVGASQISAKMEINESTSIFADNNLGLLHMLYRIVCLGDINNNSNNNDNCFMQVI